MLFHSRQAYTLSPQYIPYFLSEILHTEQYVGPICCMRLASHYLKMVYPVTVWCKAYQIISAANYQSFLVVCAHALTREGA